MSCEHFSFICQQTDRTYSSLDQTMYEGRSRSSRPDLVLFRIKLKYYFLLIVARLRTRHAQYDFWAINILCILAVIGCFYSTWKKGVSQYNEMTILTNSFVPLHALLFWLRIIVVDARFILNNELRYKFLLGQVGIVWEVLQILAYSFVLAFSTPIWQTLCSYGKMNQIFIAQKSFCACYVLSLATIRSK